MAFHAATAPWNGRRLLRGVLAVFVALALLTSLFNCYCSCLDCDDGALAASVAQSSSNDSGKSCPCSAGADCCHYLAHVMTVASQDSIASIEYVTRVDGLPPVPAPDAADLASPFKPPRA
jgi:hypothetical protein